MNELFEAMKEIAEAAADKADIAYKLMWLKLSMLNHNRILTDQYLELGVIAYKMNRPDCGERRKKELTEETALLAVRIDGTRKRMAFLQRRIDELMGLVRCPGCGNAVKIRNAYCSACGRRLAAAEEENVYENENEMNIPTEEDL